MIIIQGYITTKLLAEKSGALIYRAYQESNKKSVLIKVTKKEIPNPEEISQLHHEYNLLQMLDGQGAMKAIALEQYQQGYALILEDSGVSELKEITWHKKISVNEFLIYALNIIKALEQVHSKHIIHLNLDSENIFCNPNGSEVKISDFSHASTLSYLNPEVYNSAFIDVKDSIYSAPEITGKLNRKIDYRSDYYSLGIIFYEILNGSLPFQNMNPSEIIYNKLVNHPQPLSDVDPSIPRVISDIIMKLLAKYPEDRYQSINGIRNDLSNCLKQLESKNLIDPFPIATHDIADVLTIPEKIYGHEETLQQLFTEFDNASHGRAELVLIAASEPGIGKTALVRELYDSIVKHNGYFIASRFEKLNRNIPYAALSKALNNLITQILYESETQIREWRNRIQETLGSNGEVVTDIVPNLTLLIGKQPPAQKLGPAENKNRFNLTFLNFLQALATEDHPLVIYLDDLQWGDIPTLKMIESFLLNTQSKYVLIVAAFNSDEIGKMQVMTQTFEVLKKSGLSINMIQLGSLTIEDVSKILVDTLHQDEFTLQSLVDVCYEKTKGNPFYLKQFLKLLYADKIIFFNHTNHKWQWNITDIEQKKIPNDFTSIVTEEIKNLSEPAQLFLQYAACFGNEFDLRSIAQISEKSILVIADNMYEAMLNNLIFPINNPNLYDYITEDSNFTLQYKFINTYVQKAAYSMINKKNIDLIHLKIAHYLLETTPKEEIEKNVLEIVRHFNESLSLISADSEKAMIASWNLKAGIKAKQSAAYKAAMEYLKIGISCLNDNCWNTQYELTLSLNTEMTEAAYLSSELTEMEQYSEIVLKNSKNTLQKTKIIELRILYYSDQNKLSLALDTGIKFLTELGISLPRDPNNFQVILKLIQTQSLLRNKKPDDLLTYPDMQNQTTLAAMRILLALLSPSYIANSKLYQLITYEAVNLSMKNGNTAESALFYVNYGAILCILGQVERGFQFGQFSIKLLDKFNADRLKSKLYTPLSLIIFPKHDHVDKSISLCLEGIQIGLDIGDIEYAGYLAAGYSYHVLFSGKELNVVMIELEKYANFLKNLHIQVSYHYVSCCLQTINELLSPRNGNNALTTLSGNWFEEETVLPELLAEKNNVGALNVYICKILLYYLFQDYPKAYAHAKLAEDLLDKTIGLFLHPIFYFYYSLTCLQLAVNAKNLDRFKLLRQVKKNQARLKRWSKNAPMNYLHRFYLVEAQYAEVTNKQKQAVIYFDKAIELARQNRFIEDEALANELATKFYKNQGKEKISKIYLNDAYYCYKKWGAISKVKQLEEQYPFLMNQMISGSINPNLTKGLATDQLNLSGLIKSSEEISREINLDALLIKMMSVVIENAGANVGYFLLEKNGNWHIEAEANVENKTISILKSLPLNGNLPATIIQAVIKTKNPIVLEDAAQHQKYAFDDYVKEHQPKSILCMPLLKQGAVSGLFYLENNLTIGAFTQDKLTLLNLLSAQIVIAIDNAMLYKQVIELNEAGDRFVPHKFLNLLEKESIIDVKLGDQIQKELSIMFCNINDFASLSNKMTSQERMNFINDYIAILEPVISRFNGIIDKYINDTIMAIFITAEDALNCAIGMQKALTSYNINRVNAKLPPLIINTGINTGMLNLGIVGGKTRMEGTVVSDAVNIASRLNGLTKLYKIPLLISEKTYSLLTTPKEYAIRMLNAVKVKGKSESITIYEIFSNDDTLQIEMKVKSADKFERGINLFQENKYSEALVVFQKILTTNPDDSAAAYYVKCCQQNTR